MPCIRAMPLSCRPHTAFLVLLSAIAFEAGAAASDEGSFAGPFNIEDGITLFVVNETGEPFEVDVRYRDTWRVHQPGPCLVRVFDPDETLIVRHEFKGEPLPPETRDVPWEPVRLRVPASGSGVYQIIINGMGTLTVDVALSPQMPFGVMGHPQWLIARSGQFDDVYVYLPPQLDVLPIETQGDLAMRVQDESGRVQIELRGSNPSGQLRLPAGEGRVWRFLVDAQRGYRIDFRGIPVIFCPDERTARAIRGSIEVLEDGTICFHKFQVRAWRLLQQYRNLPPSQYDVPLPDLSRYRRALLRDPARHMVLFGPRGVFSNLPAVLHEQNLDRASPWFGSIHVWRDPHGRPRPQHPHSRHDRLNEVFRAEQSRARTPSHHSGGGIHMGREATLFAALYDFEAPFNPLYRHPALLNRAIVAALQNLMMIRKHELVVERSAVYYGGQRAFGFSWHMDLFSSLVPHAPDDVREVLIDGYRRLVDRSLIGQVNATVNQWAHIPGGIYGFYEGTGEAHYREWTLRHVQWIANGEFWGRGQTPAGYMSESEGPDATYNGITTGILARLYNETKEPLLLDMLRRCYWLLNHTIAPDPFDPSGYGVGASDFCHRTAGNWWHPQGHAGLAIMADHLPEAAVREGTATDFPRLPRTEDEYLDTMRRLSDLLAAGGRGAYNPATFFDYARHPGGGAGRIAGSGSRLRTLYRFFPEAPTRGELPMVAQERFTRNFGDEFFCVRRPGYYVMLYAGSPMGSWQRARLPQEPDRLFPRNGGGISMLWSPSMGASILGRNWSTWTAHTIVATDRKNRVRWEDYWSVQASACGTWADGQQRREVGAQGPDANGHVTELTVTGAIHDQPLRFERHYVFHDHHIDVRLTIEPVEAVALASLEENVPHLVNERARLWVTPLDRAGRTIDPTAVNRAGPGGRGSRGADVRAHAVMLHYRAIDEVHVLVFDEPRTVRPDFSEAGGPWGRIAVALPGQWEAGQSRTFRTQIIVTQRDRVPQAIKEALARFDAGPQDSR